MRKVLDGAADDARRAMLTAALEAAKDTPVDPADALARPTRRRLKS